MSTIKTATVKVMQSHNYCHFEASLTIEANENESLSLSEIDKARISCQKLTDKAVIQYKNAKNFEQNRTNNSYERAQLERECGVIRSKNASDWTPLEKAKIKTLEDYNFESQFYDFDNNDDGLPF